MRRLRARISETDSAQRFTDMGVDVFLGNARFTGRRTVDVNGKQLRFAKAVIATGARAAAPPIPGLDRVDYLTNETLFNLTELPRRLTVIGAGPIGCEMAQTFQRFSSEVTLLELADHILIKEDADAAEIVQRSFSAQLARHGGPSGRRANRMVQRPIRVQRVPARSEDGAVLQQLSRGVGQLVQHASPSCLTEAVLRDGP